MADQPDKWVQIIADLIRRTQENRLKWTSYVPKDSSNIKIVFRAPHKDKALRLYRTEPSTVMDLWTNAMRPHKAQIILEVTDADQNTLWRFPDSPALSDLLDSVKFQTAGIDEFFRDLLNE